MTENITPESVVAEALNRLSRGYQDGSGHVVNIVAALREHGFLGSPPTDDGREALKKILIDNRSRGHGISVYIFDPDRMSDAVLASGFRFVNADAEGGHSGTCFADQCVECRSEVVPTGAQVEAALNALSRFNEWTENPRGAMRAALKATAATPEPGKDDDWADGLPEGPRCGNCVGRPTEPSLEGAPCVVCLSCHHVSLRADWEVQGE